MKYDYDAGFTPERPEERELAGALSRFAEECMEHGGDAGGPYLTNQDGVEQAGSGVAAAAAALLGRAEAAGVRAEYLDSKLAEALKDLNEMARLIRHQLDNDDACCFACAHNVQPEDYCPGWDDIDCFEWCGR